MCTMDLFSRTTSMALGAPSLLDHFRTAFYHHVGKRLFPTYSADTKFSTVLCPAICAKYLLDTQTLIVLTVSLDLYTYPGA